MTINISHCPTCGDLVALTHKQGPDRPEGRHRTFRAGYNFHNGCYARFKACTHDAATSVGYPVKETSESTLALHAKDVHAMLPKDMRKRTTPRDLRLFLRQIKQASERNAGAQARETECIETGERFPSSRVAEVTIRQRNQAKPATQPGVALRMAMKQDRPWQQLTFRWVE